MSIQANVRPLPPILSKIAESELNENLKLIGNNLEAFKTWLSQNTHLKTRTDDQFLISFLRGCKYSLERAKEKFETYHEFRTHCPEFFSSRDPKDEKIRKVAELGPVLPLPEAHPDGSRLVLARVFVYNPDELRFGDILNLAFMIGDRLIAEDDNIIVSGVTMIVDLTGLTMAHATQITPNYLKKISTAIQDAYPFRQKGIHFINAPSIFDMFFKLFQTFVGSKLKKRLFLHDSLESLHKQVPKDLLPEEYGGEKLGKLQVQINNWCENLLSKRDWFLDDVKYRAINTKSKNSSKTTNNGLDSNEIAGGRTEGSFRKLEFD